MNHKTCKNIPVIMMSSNDSMSTVFKCFSKGAVDFLVKPIRKNELKNLWQHVWSRLQSSGGSGSESGIQTQKSAKSRCPVDCKNDSGSNDEDNGCNDLNARDGSENDSKTQRFYTKRAAKVECLQHISPSYQIAESPDSTRAQVIHPKPAALCNDWVPISFNGGCQGQKELTDEIMGKDLKIGVPINAEIQYETHPRKVMNFSKQRDMNEDKLLDSDQNKEIPTLESNNVSISDERSTKAFDSIGAMAKNLDTQPLSALQVPKGLSKIPECQEKTTDNPSDSPNLELSLKRLRSRGECGSSATPGDRNVLRRSEQSAFSRYHKSTASNQAPTGCGGSCSPPDNSAEAMRAESIYNMISSSNVDPLKQGSNGSSNNNDMGTTIRRNTSVYNVTDSSNSAPRNPGSSGSSNKNAMEFIMNAFAQSEANKKETASTFAFNCIRTTAVPLPKQIPTSTNQQIVHEQTEETSAAGVTRQARGIEHQVLSGSGVVQIRIAQREAALKKFREKRTERNFIKKCLLYTRVIWNFGWKWVVPSVGSIFRYVTRAGKYSQRGGRVCVDSLLERPRGKRTAK